MRRSATILDDSFVRHGLESRTIWFPADFLRRYVAEPGMLIDTITTALTRFVRDEESGVRR